jgi:aspartate/tyrosine/aromatic aminotransferase
MIADLEAATPGLVVKLHICDHNPTVVASEKMKIRMISAE